MNSQGPEIDVDAWSVITSQEIEALRDLVYSIERELAEMGKDSKRGVESYSLSELKSLLNKSLNKEQFRKLLLKLVELQESLYRTLYSVAGMKEINIDTDMPEKRLLNIKEWLLFGNTRRGLSPSTKSKQSMVIRRLASLLASVDGEENCSKEIKSLLESSYKRSYDKYRVLRIALSACVLEGVITWENVERAGGMLDDMISLLLACRKVLGGKRLSELIARQGEAP